MKEIVAKKEGVMEEKTIFHFDRLYSLQIWHVPLLDRFYGGSYSLRCPSLRMLGVFDSTKLKLFGRQSTNNLGNIVDDQNSSLSTQQPRFIIEEAIPKLEEWRLNNEEAIMMLHDPQWKDHYLSKLKLLQLSNFEDNIAATFLDSIVQKAPNLKSLFVVDNTSLKEIFQDRRVAYKEDKDKIKTRLQTLILSNVKLPHICREGCQVDPILEVLVFLYVKECVNLKTLVPSSVTFSHLTDLVVDNCRGLTNLFYSSTATSLVNLESITLKECNSLEEIVTHGMNETKDEIVFRSLVSLKLETLPRLNSFSSSQCFFKFPLLVNVVVRQCARIKTFCGRARTPFLRKVIIKEEKDEEWCWEGDLNRTIKKMYEDKIAFRDMEHLDLSLYPELRDSWRNPVENKIFCNLKSLVVEHCDFLSDVLIPSNLLRALGNLEEIQVRHCHSLEAVLEFDTAKEEAISEREVIHLRKINLSNLPKLQHIWKPSLGDKREEDQVLIQRQQPVSPFSKVLLPKLEIIIIEDMENLETIWHPVLTPNSMGRFEILKVKNCPKIQHIFPTYMYRAFAALETLKVKDCNLVKEIFQLGVSGMQSGEDTTQLKNIALLRLPKLKQIWSRDPQSSLLFKSLQVVRVEDCDGLEYLFPFSIAMSLPLLEAITIKNAEKMKEIVSKREEPLDNLAKFEFNQLTSMMLSNLQNLQGFCAGNHSLSCSSMKKLNVFNCKKLKLFMTQGTSSQGKVFNGNLQVSMQHAPFTFEEGAFSSFNHLEFSEYPELEELWYGHVGQKIFCNLKHLVVRKCTFLSNMIFTSNLLQVLHTLEELEVAECDSLEVVFDVKALDDKVLEPKEVSGLKRLTLSGLLNLKRIWNTEAREIISFSNLQIVQVDKCPNLKCLFSPSLSQNLRHLERLDIKSCGVEQIVANEEGLEDLKFCFPLLRIFKLIDLTQLNNFYSKRYTLECPSLEVLNIGQCEALQIFAFEHLDSHQLRGVCVDLPIQQALFHIKKVSENLEQLSLNQKDAIRILNGNYDKKLFQRTEVLRLQYFQETPMKFLNELLERFSRATTLQARWSSFETLFPVTESSHFSIKKLTQIKEVVLYQLEQLEHIWNDNSASYALVPNLKNLYITECCRLVRLAPPSASFTNLISLEVKDCNGLMYLMTSYTAKSLIHLRSLTVRNCGKLEEVVMTEEGESKEEITFESLTHLELTCLSGFKSFCFAKHTFIFPSLVRLEVTGCHKMQNFSSGITVAPILETVKVENGKKCWKGDLNSTIKHLFIEKAIQEGDGGDITTSSQTHQCIASTTGASSSEEQVGQSKPNQIITTGKQETDKIPSQFDDKYQNQLASSGIERPLSHSQVTQNASTPSTHQATGLSVLEESQDSETHSSRNLFKQATIANKKESLAKETQEMGENIERPFVEAAKIAPSPTGVDDAVTGIHVTHKNIDKPFIQATQNAWDITIVQKKEESHDRDIHLSKNLFNHSITSMDADYKEIVGTQETYESKRRLSVHDAENLSSPTIIYDTGKSNDPEIILAKSLSCQATNSILIGNRATPIVDVLLAIGTQEIHETIDKPLNQTDQDAEELAMTQNTEGSHDSYIETAQEICDMIEKSSVPSAQNMPNSTMIPKAAIDPSPSRAPPEPTISSIQKSNIYRNYKGMIDIPEQNMTHLDAGVNRHPQVLNWLNTKRPRVFASSFFSLFSEVARILRTTRRIDLTEDDRNYIRECCAALQGVGFDDSWISHVHCCIEECCEDGEELERKVEEAEGQASNLKAQLESITKELASVEESLVLLRDKAGRLHDFIES